MVKARKSIVVVKRKAKPKRPKVRQSISRLFDQQALAYAKLLLDPCHAPLTHPVGSPTGGILFRSQAILTLGALATTTCGVVHWVPGSLNNGNTELFVANGLAGATPLTFATAASAPGKAFLAASSSDMRCVAACMRIMYDGSEAARSGRIAYGNTIGGFIQSSTTTSTDSLMAQMPVMERTPQAAAEIRWKPTQFDDAMIDPQATLNLQDRDRRGAITAMVVGHPVGAPLTVELTAVYEYLPLAGQGIVAATTHGANSNWTVSSVVNALSNAYENPWIKKGVDSFLSNLGTIGNQTVRKAGQANLARMGMLMI